MRAATSVGLAKCLLQAVGGNYGLVALPESPFYQAVNVAPYNLNIPVKPAAVTYPQSAQQIAAVVKCAATNNLKVQARSGGHSYANYCIGGTDGAIVVDLKNMQQFSYDPTTFQATIGSGTQVGDIDKKLIKAGNRAMSHGVCPSVGLGGHATIGGLGPSSRMWGSSLDHVLEVEVVLANSSIVQASQSKNSDLFFAIRGAASGFGIVTQFKVRTQAAPGQAVQYAFAFPNGNDARTLGNSFRNWQKFISNPSLTRKFGSQFNVLSAGAVITGTFYGTPEEFHRYNFTAIFPEPFTSNVTVFEDWLGLAAHQAEDVIYRLAAAHTPFYAKSIAIPSNVSIPDDGIDKLFQYLASADKSFLWVLIADLTGGVISDTPITQTSYRFRQTKMFLQPYIVGNTNAQPRLKTFLDKMLAIVEQSLPNLDLGSYAGYVDPDLPNAQQAYWGINLPRLEVIKRAVDPTDLFHNPQSVRPAQA